MTLPRRSSHRFVPLDAARREAMVAPDKVGAPDPAGPHALVVRRDLVVSSHLGTWHHPLRVLNRPGRFAC